MPDDIKKEKPITDEIATASKDIDIFAGWINRLENPDPTLRTESGGKGIKLYDEVKRDCHAGSVLQTRYLAVIGKPWKVIPAESGSDEPDAKNEEIAGFVAKTLKAANFEQGMQELLQAILYGFYPAEIIWKATNDGIRISKIRSKHPRRFSFTIDRELRLLTPADMIEGEPVSDRKFIVFNYGSSDNPYGEGLGQSLWWPIWFKKHGIKFWIIFLEKFGMPTAVGKYPTGTDPTQQQALLDAIDAIQNETGVKIPDTMAIELLEATRSGNVTYESLCDYMDRQISKRVLGQTLTTEVKGEGSYAASQTHNEVRQDIIEADAGLLCECLNETLIPWIVDYNFPGVTEYPQLEIRVEEEKNMLPLAERDEILINKIGLPVGEKYFYDTYGIPRPEDDAELVKSRDQGAGIRDQGAGSRDQGNEFAEELDIVDIYTERSEDDGSELLDGLVEPVRSLVENAKSFEEIRDGLIELGQDMDVSEIGNLMQRAFTAAELAGRYEVHNGG